MANNQNQGIRPQYVGERLYMTEYQGGIIDETLYSDKTLIPTDELRKLNKLCERNHGTFTLAPEYSIQNIVDVYYQQRNEVVSALDVIKTINITHAMRTSFSVILIRYGNGTYYQSISHDNPEIHSGVFNFLGFCPNCHMLRDIIRYNGNFYKVCPTDAPDT